MAQPFNYSINVPDPSSSVMGGVQNALGIAKMVSQRNLAEQQSLDLKNKREQQAQMQADLGTLAANPTPSALASMMVKYPTLSENFKRTYDVLSNEQKGARLDQATQVYAALESGRPEIAQQYLVDQAVAHRNSGQEKDAKVLEDLATLIKESPDTAKTSTGLFLASTMGPDKFAETFTKLQAEQRDAAMAPAKLTEAQARAQKAAVDARFAESMAVQDLNKKGWDIAKIQNDMAVSRDNSKIAALNANLRRETNDLKRAEIGQKLEDAKLKRDKNVRERAAEISSARSGIDNSISTIDRLVSNPELDNILGSVEGSSFYPTTLAGLVSPTGDSDKRADAVADLETIQSQSFLNNLMEAKSKGATFGALTEKEGDRLTGYVQSLKTKQSEKQFRDNLSEMQRLLLKSRANLSEKYGVPDTIPDTPAAQPSPATIDELLQKYGGGE